jgi:replication fork protection complex subunit Tof1/Swi1
MAMFKNPHLRLLMNVVGLQRLAPGLEETLGSLWMIPPALTADHLKESVDFITKAEFSPPVFEEGVLAEHQLRRKTAPRKRAEYDDDESELDDDILFPAGGPTVRKAIDDPSAKKKPKRRLRRRGSDAEPVDDAVLEERARKRREREKEKARKIKSEMFVYNSDDEFDEDQDAAFFAREAAIRDRAAKAAATAPELEPKISSKKRTSTAALLDSDDEDEDAADSTQRTQASSHAADGTEQESDMELVNEEDTPLSSSPELSSKGRGARKKQRLSQEELDTANAETDVLNNKMGGGDMAMADEDDDEDIAPVARARVRTKGGFVVDSSDEE